MSSVAGHLRSIFTNLLDNAICAVKPLAQEQRRISICTAVKGDYLHIRCINPFCNFTEKVRRGSGYGQVILADIAGIYNGKFVTEKHSGEYVAVVSVLG